MTNLKVLKILIKCVMIIMCYNYVWFVKAIKLSGCDCVNFEFTNVKLRPW